MKGGHSHNFNHFTGKKKLHKAVMKKKKPKAKKVHKDKYSGMQDIVKYV